jgi:hypothetical protein
VPTDDRERMRQRYQKKSTAEPIPTPYEYMQGEQERTMRQLENSLLYQAPLALGARAIKNIPAVRNAYWGMGKGPMIARNVWNAVNPAHAPVPGEMSGFRDAIKSFKAPTSIFPLFLMFFPEYLRDAMKRTKESNKG